MANAPKTVRAELRRMLRKAGGNEVDAANFDNLQTHDAVLHKAKDLCTRHGLPA